MQADTRVVVAASDLSERGVPVIAYAAGLADRLGRPLLIVHAIEVPPPRRSGVMAERSIERLLRAARRGLAAQAGAIVPGYPRLDVRTAVVIGRPDNVIVNAARDAFIAVVATDGGRSSRLLTRMPCPVIAVPAGADAVHRGPIVVGAAVGTGRTAEAGTAFATALLAGHPSYLVTVHPAGQRDVNLQSGALPIDRLIIRVVAPERDLVSAVTGLAAQYAAGLVVVEIRSPRWPLWSDGAAMVRAVVDAVGCPIAVVAPRSAMRPGASRPVAEQREGSDHAHRPHAAVG